MVSIELKGKNKDVMEVKYQDRINKKNHVYAIRKEKPECWPVHYYTATTDMKDWIGNIIAINNDNTCQIKGVYRGYMVTMPKVKFIGKFKIGQRVMVTEHISVNGKFEMIATKERILDGDNNFVNVGFSGEKQAKILRIDLYTGDCREMIVGSVRK